MIGAIVKPSRETERQVLIEELKLLGIYETLKGESLEKESYYSLRSMLATARAVAQ